MGGSIEVNTVGCAKLFEAEQGVCLCMSMCVCVCRRYTAYLIRLLFIHYNSRHKKPTVEHHVVVLLCLIHVCVCAVLDCICAGMQCIMTG